MWQPDEFAVLPEADAEGGAPGMVLFADMGIKEVADQPVLITDDEQVDGKYVLLGGKELYGELRETWEEIEVQIARFKEADAYLISTPMWNFSLPYALKQYLDLLIQPGYLFRYVDGGVEGFLRGRRVVVVSARGGGRSGAATFHRRR